MIRRYIPVLALAVIICGSIFAFQRETLRDSLDTRFQRINDVYFEGRLFVSVRWSYLPDDYGVANDDSTIVVDWWSVRDGEKLDEILKHEMCHSYVGVEHQHDTSWQDCMTRFDH
jgi:hypothetical protein